MGCGSIAVIHAEDGLETRKSIRLLGDYGVDNLLRVQVAYSCMTFLNLFDDPIELVQFVSPTIAASYRNGTSVEWLLSPLEFCQRPL